MRMGPSRRSNVYGAAKRMCFETLNNLVSLNFARSRKRWKANIRRRSKERLYRGCLETGRFVMRRNENRTSRSVAIAALPSWDTSVSRV